MTNHFVFDIETLSTESTAVVLSAAIVWFNFDDDATTSYDELVARSLYVKFRMKEQADIGRHISKSTVEWWKKQGSAVRDLCFKPSHADVSAIDGLQSLKTYFKEYGDNSSMVWARGSLDQMVYESLCRSYEQEPFVNYNKWMDIRTAIRLMKETADERGYCKVPDLDTSTIDKHNPIADICLDTLQLVQGA